MKVETASASTPFLDTAYAYDATGRLSAIQGNGQIHRYTYHPGTRQPATRSSGNLVTTYAYDTGRGMLTAIENKAGSATVSKYIYSMNNRGQRTQASQSGSAFAAPSGFGWLFNSRGEVVAANHTADIAKNRAYRYDPIGNVELAAELHDELAEDGEDDTL